MSTQFDTPPANLAEVHDRLGAVTDLDPRKRSDLRYFVKKMETIFGRPLAEIPAQPHVLSRRFRAVDGSAHGLGRRTSANVRSGLRDALMRTGAYVHPGKSVKPLVGKWKEFYDLLDKYASWALSRCCRFFQEQGLQPEDVNIPAFERFEAELRDHSICQNPARTARVARQAWNRVAKAMPELGVRVLPFPERERITLKESEMPRGVSADLKEFRDARAKPDYNARRYKRRPQDKLEPATLDTYWNLLWLTASIVIKDGHLQVAEPSLVDVLQPSVIEPVLISMRDRNNGETSSYIHKVAIAAVQAAEYFARVEVGRTSDEAIIELREIAKSVEYVQDGLADKNRERLRSFNDDRTMALFLHAWRLMTQEFINASELTHLQATTTKYAFAHAIAISHPLRRYNLATLRLDRISRVVVEGAERLLLFVPANETKTGKDIEALLPPFLTPLYDFYVKKARPLLAGKQGGPWLFPGEEGGHVHPRGFGEQLAERISRIVGAEVNPHLYRHIAGKHWLDHHDGDYLTVQKVLGHSKIDTTVNNYTEFDGPKAARKYDEFVQRRLEETLALVAAKSRRGKRGAQ